MDLSRRRFVQTALLAAAGAGVTAACGGGSDSGGTKNGKNLTLWYWGGGLSDKVVADAKKHFTDVTLKSSVIGGTFKQKLLTTMNGGSFVPDITGIKGEDIASFLPNANRFIDLNTLGADKIASQYLEWKLKQGQTQDGKQIGFPIDIGPTAMFYREDMFAKAGLPTDPAKVAEEISTWEDYFAIGAEIQKAYPKSFLINNMTAVFDMAMGQQGKRMVDEDNKFIGDQDHIRKAWDLAARVYELGVDAKINDESLKAAVADGTVATQLGAAWMALDIKDMAPKTSGKWRVAPLPGGPSNQGGSFLALPKECRNPEAAFKVIKWLLSPENEARGFTDAALFPACPAAYKLPALTGGDPFFGGQKTIEVFGPAAEKVPAFYEAPTNAAVAVPYYNELTNIESKGKKPDDAWKDAVSQAKQIAKQQGVS
ncbi:carbohydrate ABC transporter substrate-binding protein [Streptomyces montanus]|uniref:Carbohydrate ABC transporter substrate-binding protein n=1 Tax=Streptomyces montanus TaxID=2580423 RepID=A0A5R9FPU6_9ACTN|nr:ABC transporter substrate-binding protein [Streptomyces montanus]TLS45411.1 carbohydrate ABC transporter substrate-binding protein [Streptomyces montanus]